MKAAGRPYNGLKLGVLFLLIYLLPLGFRPLIIPDEMRYAEIPREMIASGNWVVPRLNGLRYFEKPVMGYWLTAAGITLFGHNAFGARFSSALTTGLAALLIFTLVRRYTTGSHLAFSATAIFLTFFQVAALGTFNLLDATLAFFVTAAMAAFFAAVQQPAGSRYKGLLLALCGICCGGGFLTKGFVAFAIPAVSAVPFMLWQRRFKELLVIGWIPLICALLTAAPWALMIHQQAPDFWHFFIINEHIRRFAAADAQHRAFFGYYLLLLPAAALPWSAFFPAAAIGIRKTGMRQALQRWALCWFVFPLLFFSVAHGKILTYILPCFAPLAILAAFGLQAYFERGHQKAFGIAAQALSVSALLCAAAIAGVQLMGLHGIRPYTAFWKMLPAAGGLAAFALLLSGAARSRNLQKKTCMAALASLAVFAAAPFSIPHETLVRKAPGDFLQRMATHIHPDTILVADERPLLAVCWIYRRSDVYQLGAGGELMYGFRYADARNRLLNLAQFSQLIGTAPGRVALVASAEKYRMWQPDLPHPVFMDRSAHNGFVFAQW